MMLSEVSLVWIDDSSLRRRYLLDIRRVERERDELSRAIRNFNTVERPAFESWIQLTFAKLLKQYRRLGEDSARLEALIREVQMECRYSRCSEERAYQRVQRRRERNETPPWEKKAQGRAQHTQRERMFGDAEDRESAEGRREEGRGEGREERQNQRQNQRQNGERDAPNGARNDGPSDAPSASFKELYRWLVKRLHPDLNPQLSAEERELWLEVQSAARDRDVDALGACRARLESSDDQSGRAPQSIWNLMGLVKKLRAAIAPLRREAKVLRKDLAWDFLREGQRETLRRTVEKQLRGELGNLRMHVELMRAQLSMWAGGGQRDGYGDGQKDGQKDGQRGSRRR